MLEKQPQALASGYRRAVGKIQKIKEFGITSTMTTDEQDEMIKLLAERKAEAEGKDWKKFVAGQRWYVEELVRFAGMSDEDRLTHEYSLAFPDSANESEMLLALSALSSGVN